MSLENGRASFDFAQDEAVFLNAIAHFSSP
jgi:hypothetical protein